MTNEALRRAAAGAGLTVRQLADSVQVDVKTVERWIALDRVPHPRHRAAVARLVEESEASLWPSLVRQPAVVEDWAGELVAIYPTRGAVPHAVWDRLFRDVGERLDVLAYAALFLTDWDPGLGALLARRAEAGVKVRLLLGDPECPAVAERGVQEGLGAGLAARIRISEVNLAEAIGSPGVELRHHCTTLYNSIYRSDGEMLVNAHAYGFQAAQSPVLHLRRAGEGRMFGHYAESFDRVWATAVEAEA